MHPWFPSWKDIAIGVAPFVAGYVVVRALDGGSAPSSPPASAPSPPSGVGGPVLISGDVLTTERGRTYFATVKTSGLVSSAANPARVEAKARELGFTDVVVFTQPPAAWPGAARADYYVRGTYTAAQPRELARHNSVGFVGGADVVEVFGST